MNKKLTKESKGYKIPKPKTREQKIIDRQKALIRAMNVNGSAQYKIMEG